MEIRKHLGLLGKKVVDRVNGFEGVVSSISFDLYGCIQATVSPDVDKEGKLPPGIWLDVIRLKVVSEKPVMAPPDFDFGSVAEGRHGPADKPARVGR